LLKYRLQSIILDYYFLALLHFLWHPLAFILILNLWFLSPNFFCSLIYSTADKKLKLKSPKLFWAQFIVEVFLLHFVFTCHPIGFYWWFNSVIVIPKYLVFNIKMKRLVSSLPPVDEKTQMKSLSGRFWKVIYFYLVRASPMTATPWCITQKRPLPVVR